MLIKLRTLCHVTVILIIVSIVNGQEDWMNCSPCNCSFANGWKTANCNLAGITQIPAYLSTEIRSIDLSNQTLYKLKDSAFFEVSLYDLEIVKLVNCHLSDIDKLAFRNMFLMMELDLSKNNLSKLHVKTFRDNKRIEVLKLNNNVFESFEDGLFSNLMFLEIIDLSNNRLTYIGTQLFANIPRLRILKLESNYLQYMNASIITNLENLTLLSIFNNPWICNCHLRPLHISTRKLNRFVQSPFCVEPNRLNTSSWTELNSEEFACEPQIINANDFKTTVEARTFRNFTLAYKVRANPIPKFTWMVVNSTINFGNRYLFNSMLIGNDTYWFNMTINSVVEEDAGEYIFSVENLAGNQETHINLSVRYLAPTKIVVTTIIVLEFLLLFLVLLTMYLCYIKRRRNTREISTNSQLEKNIVSATQLLGKPQDTEDQKNTINNDSVDEKAQNASIHLTKDV